MQQLFPLVPAIQAAISYLLDQEVFVRRKPDGTPVSNIDIDIQSAIVGLISEKYPNDNIIAEEKDLVIAHETSNRYWVLDPIDGTENFILGKKEFSISLGLIEEGHFTEAFLAFPALQENYYAARGRGVLCNGKMFRPPRATLQEMGKDIILCSRAKPRLESLLQERGYHVQFFKCATYALLMVMKRRSYLYFTINTKLYDIGPMAFIVRESGGHVLARGWKELTFSPEATDIPCMAAMMNDTVPGSLYSLLHSDAVI